MVSAFEPSELALGAASASYQVEGAHDEDGRGVSIWDTFARRPGAVANGDTGDVACDSYHRVDDDLALLEGLGVDAYRFSIAWPRVVPDGRGPVSQRGLDYYDRLVDGLLAQGMVPSPTLYHWDLPQRLEDEGGWPSRATAEAFVEYTVACRDRLGDRVRLWTTHNEPWCAAYLGYAAGVHAPGRQDGEAAHRAAHHLLLSHAWAAAELGPTTDVGLALNLAPMWPTSPEAEPLADRLDALRNRVWLGPLARGSHDDVTLEVAPVLGDPDLVRDGDLETIAGSATWLGLNYYTPMRPSVPGTGSVSPEGAAYPGAPAFDVEVREPVTDIGWEVDERGLEEMLVRMHGETGLPLVVTENGAACVDDRVVDGRVDDQDRIDYLQRHLAAVDRARAAGVDVRAYFAWTLLDNFEWAEGYDKTFGLVHVDRADPGLPRTPKASYHWFADEARRRRSQRAGDHGPVTP